MKRLKKMLQFTRPHGGRGEELFVKQFIMPYRPTVFRGADDAPLAFVVDVADGHGVVPPILFSSHVDTVHRDTDPIKQEVDFDVDSGLVFKNDGRPLGADDAAGVWLMLSMIDRKVPGSYIFHRGEECGGIGSCGMAEWHTEWLRRFDYAIAFDRKDVGSVITEQMCGVTASTEFAQGLCDALNAEEMIFKYKPDATGVYTDTANYAHLIPECTNVSCGYFFEHTKDEYLDLDHLVRLKDAVIAVFTRTGINLPVVRDPAVRHPRQWGMWTTNWDGFSSPVDSQDVLDMTYDEVTEYVHMISVDGVVDLIISLAEETRWALKDAIDTEDEHQHPN